MPANTNAFTADLDDSVAVFFSRGPAFRERTDRKLTDANLTKRVVDMLLRQAPTRVLLSGWIQKPDAIADRAAWLRLSHSNGTVHLFGIRPQYRGRSQAASQLLFRALLLEHERP